MIDHLDITSIVLGLVVLILAIFISFRERCVRNKIRELNADITAAHERITEIDQQKSEFVSLASHQLRGPLAALRGYASMLLEGDFGTIGDEAREAIQKMYKATENLVILVGDYLDVSRIEQGRMQYDFSTFDLKNLLNQIILEMRPAIEKSKLTFSFDAEGADVCMINADEAKMKQVIGNIIDNSIKYTQHGSVHVWISKKAPADITNTTNKTGKVLVTVSDSGAGIDPELLPRLFEKFTRAPDASKTNIFGTGLGLYVARKIIEAHHGRIWATSPGLGKGASFFIELDLAN